VIDRSVVQEPDINGISGGVDSLVLRFATLADEINPWGTMPAFRDRALRAFWPTEPILASAMFSTCARYAAFGWTLDGPDRTVNIYHKVLHQSEHGGGYHKLALKVLQDLFTQDNGAFVEVERTDDDSQAPVLRLNHLDSARCARTGLRDSPVIYSDIRGKRHLLKWYQVITLEEFPSPVETMRDMQYCTVTRMLRAAQILRDIAIYKQEKISGSNINAVHLVGGVSKKAVDDAFSLGREDQSNRGMVRYMQPIIVSSIDPNAKPSHELLEMASLPEGFDEEISMKWYINQLALAFGGEYQDFAPLPGGNLGTAQQSQVLHQKARGKGPALFMTMLAHKLNFHGVFPDTITFKFGEQDLAEQAAKLDTSLKRAQWLSTLVGANIISDAVARQILFDAGDLLEAYLQMMGEENATPNISVGSGNRP
jgi:hypothetical protein